MGDIADMMIEGILDCETGEYISNECGYPRTRNKVKSSSVNDAKVKRLQDEHKISFKVAKILLKTMQRASRTETKVNKLEKRIEYLNASLDLVLVGEEICDGITTARQEIEEIYGADHFKDGAENIKFEANFDEVNTDES